jgi:hypothetical protein
MGGRNDELEASSSLPQPPLAYVNKLKHPVAKLSQLSCEQNG